MSTVALGATVIDPHVLHGEADASSHHLRT
jgi:hypothetical protein